MTDIVERLRDCSNVFAHLLVLEDAAEEVERLRAENEQLKLALSDTPRDDGTVVAVGGEPGASAGKSE